MKCSHHLVNLISQFYTLFSFEKKKQQKAKGNKTSPREKKLILFNTKTTRISCLRLHENRGINR